MKSIPFFGLDRQYVSLREELLDATDQVLKTGILLNGNYNNAFSDWLAKKTGTTYSVLVHSGTQALEILAKFIVHELNQNCRPGSWDAAPSITIPNLTFPATLNAMLTSGMDVTIADTDHNGLLTEETLTTTSCCFVGLYGAPAPIPIPDYCIVDGAQHWLTVSDGNVGIGMAISFDPTKNLSASGNGGAIVTDNVWLYEFAADYIDNGKPQSHQMTGSNSKISEIDCAHLLVRAKYIDEWQNRRKEIRTYWLDKFKNLGQVRCLSKGFVEHSDQKFVIYSSGRDYFTQQLNAAGIETRIHYLRPLSELAISDGIPKPDFLSVSSMLSSGVLSLPIYPELTDSEVEYIADQLIKICTK